MKIKVVHRRGDELQCYCLVNDEKVPSLYINPVKNTYNCFSCGAHGSAGALLRVHDLDTQETIDVSEFTPATIFGGETEGYEYMLERGFNPDTLEEWEIVCSDQYILIPVRKRSGDPVGVIYRHWQEDKPKYLYNKGFQAHRHLFGTYLYIPNSQTYIMEGALDVMWLYQFGFKSSVGIFGTNLSDIQTRLLHKLSGTVCLCLDNDKAGKEGTKKAINKLIRGGFNVKVLQFPKGIKDIKELQLEELTYVFKHNIINYLVYLVNS